MSTTPLLITSDDAAILRQTNAVNNGLPQVRAIYAAYNAIPGLQPITTADWINLLFDTDGFLNDTTIEFYRANYATAHQALGIEQEQGLLMAASKMPDYTELRELIEAYRKAYSVYNAPVAPEQAYLIQDSAMIINQAFIDKFTADAKLIFTTNAEMDIKQKVDNLVSALSAFKTLPNNLYYFHPGGMSKTATGVAQFDFNQLYELVKVEFPTHDQANPYNIVPNMDFFRKLHNYVVVNNLQ